MDGLEVHDDIRFHLEDEPGEGQPVEVEPGELRIERDHWGHIVHGEHTDVAASLEPADQLTAGPAPGTCDQHPSHHLQARSPDAGTPCRVAAEGTYPDGHRGCGVRVSTRTAAVIGTGLIGGSIASGLRASGWRVVGHDADASAIAVAVERGLVDEVADTLQASVADAQLVVVAAPPKATIEILANLHTDAVVMDVAGVKQAVIDVSSHLPRFVATHPMAGREVSGPEAASPALFSGATWVIVDGADPAATEQVAAVIEDLGGRPVTMSAVDHDRAVALISHLPQIVASGLLDAAAASPDSLTLAAGSFRDLTRVGASLPVPWVEILKTNGDAVLHAIGALRERLSALEAAILSDDDSLLTILSRARATRQGLGSPVSQVRIALADRPGELAKVGHALEASGVDVRDIQMRHAPHGGGGVLTLSVRPGEEGALRLALDGEGLLIVP